MAGDAESIILEPSKIKKIKIVKRSSLAKPAAHADGFLPPWHGELEDFEDIREVSKINFEVLNRKSIEDLIAIAAQLGINLDDDDDGKQHVIFRIVERCINKNNVIIEGGGVLEKLSEGYGFLRSPEYNYLPGPEDIYISPSQIRNMGLRLGDSVRGQIRSPRSSEKYLALQHIKEVNFEKIVNKTGQRNRASFDSLTPYYATEQLILETADNTAGRIIDLFCPIGKGQRGLIVSPPKAGKTLLLQNMANSITRNHPEVYVIVLLIDERPEEVIDMKRHVQAEVISSTFDEPALRHVNVARIVLEKARRLAEQKHDVVILLDSLTRLARAYNQVEPASGKVLSGGVDSNALHKPKRFFGAARNIEEGGSLSIIATALIDTGSKMDEVIFEEFKGTGNMEIVLSRRISERRIFPAISINKSGTRREELLLNRDTLQKIFALRNALGNLDELQMIELILKKMKSTESNEAFLKSMNSGS